GNLEPVQMICEVDWKECPKAIANYIWREVVIDVIDSLRNESIVWRVLAVISVCVILLRITCFKAKRSNDIDKEIFNKVGYKVEDLELKVNILTYKLQYGAWPLPHQVQKSNFRRNLRNLRLTLSNPNDRNNWIKHVLLSPRHKESYFSYSKYYPSEHHLTELFDAKKKSMYPYLRQESMPPVEYSSKSSKSSSDISLKLNSMFKNVIDRKHHEALRNKNFQMQYRNAISVPLFLKRGYTKSGKKSRRDTKNNETVKMTAACKKFTKTMDDCKIYLKQLHDSNKNLGLIYSTSDISNESSTKNLWSDTQNYRFNDSITLYYKLQQQKCVPVKDSIDLSKSLEKSKENECEKEENKEEEKLEKIDGKQRNSEQCLELSNVIYPVLQLIDKSLLPPKMNISFCTDMFPQQLTSKMLVVPRSSERKRNMKTSQEALYQVKKKLESLHNVLRMYELQNVEIKATEKQRENSSKIDSVCQDVTGTLVPVTKAADNWNGNKNIKVESNDNTENNNGKEIQRTTSNSSEQHESDETARSSIVSIQNYSNMFNAYHVNNINDPYRLLAENPEPKISPTNDQQLQIIPNNQMHYSSSIKYEKIPERVYYAISSDSSEGKEVVKETVAAENLTLPDAYINNNQAKPFNLSDQYPVPMETDEDAIISLNSSRTEISKDSELDDKSTALLLQEALQFKRALLTRVELEKICYIDDKKEETNNESVSCQDKYPCVNNNLQSKFLDIISEEQSVSSSTEKNSRTYMFLNLKQDKQFNNDALKLARGNEIIDLDTHKKYLDSKDNLGAPSEYFSFNNMIQEGSEIKNNRLSLPKRFQENEGKIVPNNSQLKYLNDTLKPNILNDGKYDERYENQETLSCNSNLTLKRNPGACSLIEQTLLHENINKTLEMHGVIENGDPMYELTASESKETSVETNLIQDSLTSSINQSNDSNIPEPPSITVLINKSLDEGKLELDWLNVNNDFSDNEEFNGKDVKTCSTNTITLQKYDTANVINHNKIEINYSEHGQFQDKEIDSITQNSFTNLTKKELVNEMDFYKSYSNLVSPHSSIYFTDEASSSTTKLNNTYSKNLKGHAHSNLYTQNKENKLHSKHENLKDTNKLKVMTTNKSFVKISNENSSEPKNKIYSKHHSFSSKTKDLNEEKDSIDETLFNLTANDMQTLQVEETITSLNLSPRQISPGETIEVKTLKTKSRSHENYTSKSEKLKRAGASGNLKDLRSDLLNTAQTKAEDNASIKYRKLRDLSAEPRRSTGDSITLDRKRSRSQISFRTNESPREITPRSHECPSNTNSINYTESLETKLRSKDPLKSLSPTPKTSSRSCIPILKSRLEAARKTENESRPKSPMRGPLTMTMFWRDNLCDKSQNEMDEIQVEGKSRNKDPCAEEIETCIEKANDAGNHKQDSIKVSHIVQSISENADITPQKQMVIYVNIFTKHDNNMTKIVDPNKFLEYIKNRKLSVQQPEENQTNKKHNELQGFCSKNEKDTVHKIVTVISSIINCNELDQTTSTNLSAPKTQKDSLSSILLNGKLKNLCFLSVEQKEVDVTAKPSVIDTSTSISDLDNVSKASRNAINKFQICGTPKELNNEEYIMLLEILQQEPNFIYLQELQNVCKKLVSKH
ncbi:unnamed protein product, partial [Heterotrigona itama]